MKFRFLMSHHRKNSVRDKVMSIYLTRNSFRKNVGHLERQGPTEKHTVLSFNQE